MTEVGHHGLFLMDWGARQEVAAFDAKLWETSERMPSGMAKSIVERHVASEHLVRVGEGLVVSLTGRGMAAVEDARLRRKSRIPRADYTRTVFVWWLYKRSSSPVVPAEFMKSWRCVYLGERLGAGEIDRAARYLLGKGLIDYDAQWGTGDLHDPQLTSDGTDCAESGKRVSEFLASRQGPIVLNQYNFGPGPAAQGMHVAQSTGAVGTETVPTALYPRASESPMVRDDARPPGGKTM